MSAWKYSVNTVVAGPDTLKIGFTVETEHWVKFGKLEVPYHYLTGDLMARLTHAWSKSKELPPESDTPLSLTWSTGE
jgi:hypothetical protein